MDRNAILARILGPYPHNTNTLSWEFIHLRKINHRLKTVTGLRFIVAYRPSTRSFHVIGQRRISKRNKRQEVKVSRAMLAYLRSRLAPADIARCTMASLIRKAA